MGSTARAHQAHMATMASPQTEDRSLTKQSGSFSTMMQQNMTQQHTSMEDEMITDLFRTHAERNAKGLLIEELPVGVQGGALLQNQSKDHEDRSLQRKGSNALLSTARGFGGRSSSESLKHQVAEGQTLLSASDNFVLEWAYSLEPSEWGQLVDGGAKSNSSGSEEEATDGGKREPAPGMMAADANGTMDAERLALESLAQEDEEYMPVPGQGGSSSARKRRAVARAAVKDVNQPAGMGMAAGVRGDAGRGEKRKCTWRKYGQKVLKGKDFVGMDVIRCYYRCNVRGCNVKKQVEKASWQSNSEANITVTGIHIHPVEEDDDVVSDEEPTENKPRNAIMKRAPSDPLPVPPLNKALSTEIQTRSPHFVISDPSRPDCPIIFASPGFCTLTGYDLTDCVGRNCRFLQGKDTNPNAIKQISMACQLQKEIRVIVLNYKKDGSPFWNLLQITPVKDSDGKLISFVGVQMDVSERYAPTM